MNIKAFFRIITQKPLAIKQEKIILNSVSKFTTNISFRKPVFNEEEELAQITYTETENDGSIIISSKAKHPHGEKIATRKTIVYETLVDPAVIKVAGENPKRRTIHQVPLPKTSTKRSQHSQHRKILRTIHPNQRTLFNRLLPKTHLDNQSRKRNLRSHLSIRQIQNQRSHRHVRQNLKSSRN